MPAIVKTLPNPNPHAGHAGRRRVLGTIGRWFWAGAAAVASCPAGAQAAGAPAGQMVRWPAVRLIDGNSWAAEGGRPQVVVFWSVTCPFCVRHNAHVQRLYERVQRQGGPQILSVSRDRDPAAVARYLTLNRYTFPVTLEHEPLRAALSARKSIPLTVLVDRTGRIRQSIPGEMFEDDVLELQGLG